MQFFIFWNYSDAPQLAIGTLFLPTLILEFEWHIVRDCLLYALVPYNTGYFSQ
jgi:hypothetical protein